MQIIKTAIIALAIAVCGQAQAPRYDCAPASVVGPGWQVGTFPGREWETSYSYTDYQATDHTTAGMGQFWYCLLSAPPVLPADVPVATRPTGWVAATPGVTGIMSRVGVTVPAYIVVESWHANPEQASKMPDNIIAQIWSHGKITIEQRLGYQCFEMAARGWYPNGQEKRLCEGLLRRAVAVAPK
jgi:hypothetical protein